MTLGRAARLAQRVHRDRQDRYGRPMIEHVRRVAGTVPTSARAVAFVHDVAERSEHDPGDVALLVGFDDDEDRETGAGSQQNCWVYWFDGLHEGLSRRSAAFDLDGRQRGS